MADQQFAAYKAYVTMELRKREKSTDPNEVRKHDEKIAQWRAWLADPTSAPPKGQQYAGLAKSRRLKSAITTSPTRQDQHEHASKPNIANAPQLTETEVLELELRDAIDKNISPRTLAAIDLDLAGALEGIPEERKTLFRKRAAWIAQQFALARSKSDTLTCDHCGFDPAARDDLAGLQRRGLFDVHHKNPLSEGKRYTTIADFSLLCPTCHRVEHALMVASKSSHKS